MFQILFHSFHAMLYVLRSIHFQGCYASFPNGLYFFSVLRLSASYPNPQPEGTGYLFSSVLLPLTHLAWEALQVTYVTASMAHRLI